MSGITRFRSISFRLSSLLNLPVLEDRKISSHALSSKAQDKTRSPKAEGVGPNRQSEVSSVPDIDPYSIRAELASLQSSFSPTLPVSRSVLCRLSLAHPGLPSFRTVSDFLCFSLFLSLSLYSFERSRTLPKPKKRELTRCHLSLLASWKKVRERRELVPGGLRGRTKTRRGWWLDARKKRHGRDAEPVYDKRKKLRREIFLRAPLASYVLCLE